MIFYIALLGSDNNYRISLLVFEKFLPEVSQWAVQSLFAFSELVVFCHCCSRANQAIILTSLKMTLASEHEASKLQKWRIFSYILSLRPLRRPALSARWISILSFKNRSIASSLCGAKVRALVYKLGDQGSIPGRDSIFFLPNIFFLFFIVFYFVFKQI